MYLMIVLVTSMMVISMMVTMSMIVMMVMMSMMPMMGSLVDPPDPQIPDPESSACRKEEARASSNPDPFRG